MVEAVAIMGGLGVIIGIGLAIASKVFYVYVDPKILEVESALPGANCGGCGLPGCSSNAEAIVAGKASPSSCVAAGPDVAEAIAAIMGMTIEAKEPDIARPGCTFGVDKADTKYVYNGINDCRAAVLLSGGMKVCTIGCMGLGSCVKACPFNALVMGPEGLPVVIEERCTGCGTCERVCPKNIINLSSVTRRILREYTTDDCTTPCQRACPAGINIREYIRFANLGDYHKSVQVIKERNPFPTVIGRICPRPCELECRRQYVDEPVAINYIKRFVADFEMKSKKRIQPFKAPETGNNIAVIGGGVEGLSTAFFLARLGHSPTVYEATDKLGGLLRSAISAYRLPMDILDWDIEGVMEMGVKAETGKKLGTDFTIPSLLSEDNNAVFLATGGWDSRHTRMSGVDVESAIPDTYLLVDLIKSDTKSSNKIFPKLDVVIAGGGRLALKGATICRDLGSKNVTILLRQSQEEVEITNEELLNLEQENIHVVFNAALNKLFGEADQLTGLSYIENIDSEAPVETGIPVETLLLASGRFPEMIFVKTETLEAMEAEAEETDTEAPEAETEEAPAGPVRWTGIAPYKKPDHADEIGLFAEGDPITDFSAAIRAIGAGRRGAASVHQVMYGLPISLPENVVQSDADVQNVDHVEKVNAKSRQIMPVCADKDLDACGELELGFSESALHTESSRCLQCGLICYEYS